MLRLIIGMGGDDLNDLLTADWLKWICACLNFKWQQISSIHSTFKFKVLKLLYKNSALNPGEVIISSHRRAVRR